jgi:hypothetical protein
MKFPWPSGLVIVALNATFAFHRQVPMNETCVAIGASGLASGQNRRVALA